MHQACHEFVARRLPATTEQTTVLEFGSRNVNGGIKDLIGDAKYYGVDIEDGPGVDEVCDARLFNGPADIVLCLETLEHCDDLDAFADAIVRNIKPGGIGLMTCASESRSPHSAIDGGPLRPGEFYRNVSSKAFKKAVEKAGGKVHYEEVDQKLGDLRVEIHV